jgi:transposase
MTREQKIIRSKVGVLELAKQLGNVSKACQVMGYSRDSFYRFKELYDKGGELALAEMSRRQPNLKNRVAPEVEQAVLEFALEQPTWGQVRVANELRKRGVTLSPAGVRCVWMRHDLRSTKERLRALEAKAAQDGALLTESQGGAGTGEAGDGIARGVRERVPRLLRGAGHVLRRHAEGGGPDLPADVHRHLQQGGVREAVRP